eukprot:1159968-Pelagomonas_calceolata.AAC.7
MKAEQHNPRGTQEGQAKQRDAWLMCSEGITPRPEAIPVSVSGTASTGKGIRSPRFHQKQASLEKSCQHLAPRSKQSTALGAQQHVCIGLHMLAKEPSKEEGASEDSQACAECGASLHGACLLSRIGFSSSTPLAHGSTDDRQVLGAMKTMAPGKAHISSN